MRKNNMFNQKLEQIGGENIVDGITLKSEDKEKILNFINANTNQNYILNDNKLEKEKNEQEIKNTLLDEEIDCAIKENRKILIALSENVENVIEMYISEDNTERLILIDKDFCEKDNLEDIALADRLTKALFITHENDGIALLSSTAVKAVISTSSNVYHGPDSSNYAKVGSIDAGEDPVYILATSMDWYHIEYVVTSTGKHKTGYIPKSVVSSYSGGELTEEDFYGGYCYATTELDVRTCDDFSLTAPVGTLFKLEGCTFLFSYEFNGNNIAFIEYATSSGTKRGYVYAKYLKFPCETIVCIAKENISVYGGPSNSDYARFGTIYQNELMSLLAKEGNWIYVEYNTTKGRKRGYVDWTKVNPRDYTAGTYFNDFYVAPSNSACHINDEVVSVYGGPNKNYANIGSVNCENVTCFWTNDSIFDFTCIEYVVTATGLLKRGYIPSSKVNEGTLALENNSIENFDTSFSYFTKIGYGKTQLGKLMSYFKTGTGNDHLFLTFGLHGWEDGTKSDGTYYHGDGNMLLKIAKRFMQDFANLPEEKRTAIQKRWTIFVYPGINLDGIVNGYNNNAFGRCLYSGLDPNRNWGGNFVVNTTSPRYRTGSKYFGNESDGSDAIELINLRNTLRGNKGSGQNVLIDVHGWYNQTVGNADLGKHYWNSFGIPSSRHSYSYGQGYLIAWAKNSSKISTTSSNYPGIGAKTCLLELPPTTNYSDSNMQAYGDKFFVGTMTMLESISDITTPVNDYEKLYDQLESIYNLAGVYKFGADTKTRNKLVLQYLRHLDYDGMDFNYLYGFIDNDFVSYVNSNAPNEEYLNPENILVPDSVSEKIKISHLAASLNGYLHGWFTALWGKEQNALGCWAGDLVQMGKALEDKDIDINSSEAYNLIGTTNHDLVHKYGFNTPDETGYGWADWTHDIDASCMAEDLKDTPIHTVFRNFYSSPNAYNNRYHTFISKEMPNGSNDRKKILAYVKKFVNKSMLTSWGFGTIFKYNERNANELAEGFTDKLLYYYNKE